MKVHTYIAAATLVASSASFVAPVAPASAGPVTSAIGQAWSAITGAFNNRSGSQSSGLAPRTSTRPLDRTTGLGLEAPLPPLTKDQETNLTPAQIDRYYRAMRAIERNNATKINRARGQSSTYRSQTYGSTAQNGGRITDFTAYAQSFQSGNTRTPGVR